MTSAEHEARPQHRPHRPFETGTLWHRVIERTEQALRCGALRPIRTGSRALEAEGARFPVRILDQLVRKEAARWEQERQSARGIEINPFLPYEEDLFVAEVSPTHLCILNKFNVIEHHLLIITRAFEEQEGLLTLADFEALWRCLLERQALGFYNAGEIAGASQRHKHLQMVPLPLDPEGPVVPIEPLLEGAVREERLGHSPRLPFRHALVGLAPAQLRSPSAAARHCLELYHGLLEAVGLRGLPSPQGPRQSAPYNLLATRDWMLLVPRARERFHSISVNALGFAGGFLVRDEQELALLRDTGPLRVLREVVGAPSP